MPDRCLCPRCGKLSDPVTHDENGFTGTCLPCETTWIIARDLEDYCDALTWCPPVEGPAEGPW